MDLLRTVSYRAKSLGRNKSASRRAVTPTIREIMVSEDDADNFPMPPPSERMEEVSRFFEVMTHTDILEYCLGFDKPNAPALAEHVVLITLKHHHLPQKPHYMLDIGIHTIKRKDAQKRIVDPGPHSMNILANISYQHIVVQDNARQFNRLWNPTGTELTHFGSTRYVEAYEINEILEGLLHQSIDPIPADIKDTPAAEAYPTHGPCPIVILNMDTSQQESLALAFEIRPFVWQNVVATITTRQIAHEKTHDWRGKDPSLYQLLKDLKIEFPKQYTPNVCTSADWAAFTLTAAIQLVMRPKMPLAKETIQSVVNVVMLQSQCHVPAWGTGLLCTCCGSDEHTRLACTLMLAGRSCLVCCKASRRQHYRQHVEEMCPWIQAENLGQKEYMA